MTNKNSPSEEDISSLARKYWEEEGQPDGKAEEHWKRAEEQLRQQSESIPETVVSASVSPPGPSKKRGKA